MLKLQFPLKCLDVAELQDRWQCSLNVIKRLAVQQELRFFVLPVAFEIALEPIIKDQEQYQNTVNALSHTKVDHRDLYKVFKNKDGTIAVRTFNVAGTGISIELDDLIVPLEDVIAFESRCSTDSIFKLLSDDFTCVLFRGQEYTFGPQQARILQQLWQAYQDGKPWVYGKRLLTNIGSCSDRIQSIFKRHKTWRDLVLSDGNGKYRLNMDYQQQIRLVSQNIGQTAGNSSRATDAFNHTTNSL